MREQKRVIWRAFGRHSSATFQPVPPDGRHSSTQCLSSASLTAGTPVPSAGPAGRSGAPLA
eukprot:5928385-Prymnesium_polylepis.1